MRGLLEISGLRTEIRLRDATVRAVDGVSLSVGTGECLGLVGESGCGKTMTARSIIRLLPPGGAITDGSVVLGGTDLTSLSEPDMRQVRGREIGMVFQDPASSLNPTMTIGHQISESVVIHNGADRHAAAARAVEVLAMVRMPDPERAAAQYPHELSGGMRQRAMIAAALACQPRLLIADEPTTALDVTIQREILELIDDLRRDLGMAVILVTHDLGVIGGRTDKVAVMYAGRIVEQAATRAVFSRSRHPYTEALFDALPELAGPASKELYSIPGRPPDLTKTEPGCSFAPRCRYAQPWCASHDPHLDGDHPGHTYACFFPVTASADGRNGLAGAAPVRPVSAWLSQDPAAGQRRPALSAPGSGDQVLRVSGLVKNYPVTNGVLGRAVGAVSAVAGISLSLAQGQTLGLVGESGCGKTTVARLLAGLEHSDAGSIVFAGADLAALTRRQRRAQTGIQLMFQDAYGSLDPRMRVRGILSEPLVIQKAGTRRSHRRQVNRILDEVGLPPDASGRYPREFSGGQRQRLALARALIQRPAVIVADEPVSALDVSVQAQILNLMRKLQRQYALSYLFISHDLSVVRYMADTIAVMYLGTIVETGPSGAICTSPGHPYTRGLIDAVPVVVTTDEDAPTGVSLQGEPPLATEPPSGCRFRTRCPRAQEICALQQPALEPRGAAGQQVACHFPLPPAESAGPRDQDSYSRLMPLSE
jgi:peptide/nickel transport system ATP-binding protein